MWVNPDPQHPNSFIIKMDNQKLLGLTRTDKKGVTYWKFKERMKKEVNNPSSRPVVDNIQKFQQRQSQAEPLNNHANNSNQIKE